MTLLFVIPIRHPDRVRDRAQQLDFLKQTLRSIEAQETPGWKGTIVANHGQILPDLPVGFRTIFVDYPPTASVDDATSIDSYYDGVREDKGRRVLAALIDAQADDFVMIVDDDDLISRKIAGFVQSNDAESGWYIANGYSWDGASPFMVPQPKFHELCGTSLIVKARCFRFFGKAAPHADIDAVKELGSHHLIFRKLASGSAPLAPLPFPAAVYRRVGANTTQHDLAARGLSAKKPKPSLRKKVKSVLRTTWRLIAPKTGNAGNATIAGECEREFFGRG